MATLTIVPPLAGPSIGAMSSGTIRLVDGPLTRAAALEGAQHAARAYENDPFYSYVLTNELRRPHSLVSLHQAVLGKQNHHELCTSARDDEGRLAGVCLWVKPGGFPLSPRTQLRQLPLTLRAFRGHQGAMLRGLGYQRESLASHPKTPHWYLWSITVAPTHQRQGVGTALLRHGLDRVDESGLGAYLETQNRDNLAYYERFGFVTSNIIQPAPEAPPLFSMWRPAR